MQVLGLVWTFRKGVQTTRASLFAETTARQRVSLAGCVFSQHLRVKYLAEEAVAKIECKPVPT
jgi:hypothetical protein